jgi:gluconate 2-dehydrogenase gamma chain
LKTVDRTPFFEFTRMLTVLGMFSSPKYGGNYQGSGWKMMGFADQHAFAPPFGYYDAEYKGFVPYPAEKHA